MDAGIDLLIAGAGSNKKDSKDRLDRGAEPQPIANLTATFTDKQTLVIDDEEYCITGVEKVGTIVAGVHWSDGDYWTRDELQLHALIASEPAKMAATYELTNPVAQEMARDGAAREEL